MSWRAIGIFDSGVGGLTVLRELITLLPQEDTIYFGDTARVPYGTKSPETVTRYAEEITSFLLGRDIKLLIVACNTASAVALPHLKRTFNIPVVGVIEPGAVGATSVSINSRIGVIGTSGTIRSSAYTRAIKRLSPDAIVLTRACPLFVPLAEEGWIDNQVARLTAEIYLKELREADIDTLVLGCTHYPLLKPLLSDVMGSGVTLVDSAAETARTVAGILAEKNILRPISEVGNHSYFVSDVPAGFIHVGNRFLGGKLGDVYQITLDEKKGQ